MASACRVRSDGGCLSKAECGMKTGARVLLYVRVLRLPFLSASLTPVMLGAAYGRFLTGSLEAGMLGWALLGTALINLTANTANDYFDHLSHTDERNSEFVRPFTGGSRLIQEGLLSPAEVLAVSLACAGAAAAVGFWLTLRGGMPVLLLGVLGMGLGFFYTAPPVRFASRGLGEPVIALAVGILPVVGSCYLQTGRMDWRAVVVALPVASLVTAIILINEFPDAAADGSTGRRTWVVRFGSKVAMRIYAILMTCWAPALAAAVAAGLCPPLTLVALVALIPAVLAVAIAEKRKSTPGLLAPAIVLTILSHLLAGLLMAAALAWAPRHGA